MFEWLDQELSQIKNKKFHVIHNPSTTTVTEVDRNILPPSYLAFVEKYGGAKLYRKDGYYQVGILDSPVPLILSNNENLLCIGHYLSSQACFKQSQLALRQEAPIFEWNGQSLRRVADSFEQWLTKRAADARKSYIKTQWKEIMSGPKPFNADEQSIVDARRQISWRLAGFNDNGDARIAVKNNSNIVLPYLSIGARSKDNTIEGRIWLNIADVQPGEERIIEHPGYKDQIARNNLELFPLPDPEPEDRSSFWEFRTRK
jgi:hypothetical protein